MKYLIPIILALLMPLGALGQTRGVYYDNATRNVGPTDLDYVGASGNFTNLSQAGVAVVTTARTVTAGVGLSGGGDLSANRTFTLDLSELVDNQTVFDGANASRTITFNLSAGDPVLSLGSGVFNISSGTLQQGGVAVVLASRTVTIAGTANEIDSSAGAQDLSANRTWTLSLPTALTFTGKTVTGGTFSSPTIGTPTFTGAWTLPDNVRQTFNPGADAAGINVGSHAGDPGTPSNGDLWYSTAANALRARINGSTVSLGAGGGGSAPVGTMVNAGTPEQYALPYYSDTTGTNMAPSGLKTDATGTNFYAGTFYLNFLVVSNLTAGMLKIDSNGNLTNAVEGTDFTSPNSTNSWQNKTFDAAATGNVLKQTKTLILQRPDYGDGVGAVPQTNTYTASGLMHFTFSGNAETNANWTVYEFDCPADLDTTVAMTARFAFLSGGTDSDDYVFHLTYAQVAPGTAYPTGTGISTLPIVLTVTPTTAANGDLQSGTATLTGWAAALTPGRAMTVRVARLQNTQDDGARDVQLVIQYGSTL